MSPGAALSAFRATTRSSSARKCPILSLLQIMELYPTAATQLSAFIAGRPSLSSLQTISEVVSLVEQYEKDAKKHWEKFYRRHGANFFKDRHYLNLEFPELLSCHPLTILEVVRCDTDKKSVLVSGTFRSDVVSATAAFRYSKCYQAVRSGQSISHLVPSSFSSSTQNSAPSGFTRSC